MRHAFDPGRAVRHGWEAMKLAPAPLFVGALIMNFTQGGGGSFNNVGNFGDQGGNDWDNGGYDYDWGSDWDYRIDSALSASSGMLQNFTGSSDFDDPALIVGMLIGAVCFFIIIVAFFVGGCWVKVGWIRLHEQVITDGAGTFGTLFGGKDRIIDMVLFSLLKFCIVMATMLVAFFPGGLVLGVGIGLEEEALMLIGGLLMFFIGLPVMWYVGYGLYLGDHALVLEGRSPMDALDRTWTLAKGNRLRLFLFNFVLQLVAVCATLVGLCLCIVGVIATAPTARAVIDVGLTESFLMHTRGEEQAKTWKLVEIGGGLY
ncbi:MAG TPA: hypothetical protein QGF58_27995 [Myxococcota bacterium]|nr:hypothetical protein [Myxococcota bacterium]